MGLRIGTNVTALNAQKALWGTKNKMDTAMARLSSGNRINKASDDAAGLAISENMKAQMRGLKQANRNAQDGISMIQTAEGSLGEVSNMLIRLRELGVQAASDTIGDRERGLANIEYSQLLEEIDRITGSSEFNGTPLLNGQSGLLDFQIGVKNSVDFDRISFNAGQADAGTTALGLDLTNIRDKVSAQTCLSNIDGAINYVNQLRAGFGAIQNRLNSTVEGLQTNLENLSASNSRIRDADIAEESTELAKQNILLQAGTSVLSQANQQPGLALQLLSKG
ncbi:flagellin FliC [Bdellovibrio sp. qaytius]|nr:flagellin FliC [Bdellovibrio sp. qaytius]